MAPRDIEPIFKGIWRRCLKEPSLSALTDVQIVRWAVEKGVVDPVATACNVGPFSRTPGIVLTAGAKKAFFPTIEPSGDEAWALRRARADEDAALWDKVEWFLPLWLPLGDIQKLLTAVRFSPPEQAIMLFDYHTSTLYTLAFQAMCIEQIMPQARSLRDIVPLAREAYLGVYSGYRASSIAALFPAIEGSLTRIANDLPESAKAPEKIDHAIGRAIKTAADIHFGGMWVPDAYKTTEYLLGQDERVFVFETFRRWLKNHFFCNTADYRGLTGLNRHMFAHGTVTSWQKMNNFSRLVVALATLAVIDSWYESSGQISFIFPEMNDDSKLLWQQALLRGNMQMTMKLVEQDLYQKNGRLVPELPTDNGVTMRKAVLTEDCMRDLVRPLRDAGWSIAVKEPDDEGLFMTVTASHDKKQIKVALLYSCGSGNELYRRLAEDCDIILYRGAPYNQDDYAYGITVHVGPVLGWQPPQAS